MRWECRASAGETILRAWVETKFVPPDVDDYVVRLVQGAAQGKLEVATHYWDFEARKWIEYPHHVMLGDAGPPGHQILRDVWLDNAVELTQGTTDLTQGITEPEAQRALSCAIKKAKADTSGSPHTG